MLVQLSDRVTRVEQICQDRFEALEVQVAELSDQGHDQTESVADLVSEMAAMQSDLQLDGGTIARRRFKCKGTFVGHQGPIWALAVHGDLLFTGSSDETIKVWELQGPNFSCKETLSDHSGIVHALTTHNGKLYSGSSDRTIKVWDIGTCELLDTLSGHADPVCTLAIANGMLWSGSLKAVMIWDIYSHEPIGELSGLHHWVRALVATGSHLFAGSYQTISIWSSQKQVILKAFAGGQEPPVLQTLNTSGGSVYSLCVTDDLIMCGTFENVVHIWELSTFQEFRTLEGHDGTVYALAIMVYEEQRLMFSASYDKTIRVWDLNDFNCVQVLDRHENSANALTVNKGWLFSGAADSSVKIWSQ